jgi:hypothetical protein
MNELSAAINAIMKDVGYVQKEGRVQGGGANYRYAGEADLIRALRPAMVEHGVYCYVAGISNVEHETYETKSGGRMNLVRLVACVRFAKGGDWLDSYAIGEGTDSGDKAAAKALTGAYKYALRETFCIETGDDPDNTSSDTQERAAPSVPKPVHPGWTLQAGLQLKEWGVSVFDVVELGIPEGTPKNLVPSLLVKWSEGLAGDQDPFDAVCLLARKYMKVPA